MSYRGAHYRVEQARGKPQACEKCGTNDPTRRYEWANLTKQYDDVFDYIRLCVSCHRKMDDTCGYYHIQRGKK